MFAHHGIARSQLSQNERGVTIERSRGSRYPTTQTKLPRHAPKRKAIAAPIPPGKSSVIASPFLPIRPPSVNSNNIHVRASKIDSRSVLAFRTIEAGALAHDHIFDRRRACVARFSLAAVHSQARGKPPGLSA